MLKIDYNYKNISIFIERVLKKKAYVGYRKSVY